MPPEQPFRFSPDTASVPIKPNPIKKFARIVFVLTAITLVLLTFLYRYITYLNQPLAEFPVNTEISIPHGTNVRAITEMLEIQKVVRSGALLYYTLVLFHNPTDIKASTYLFDEPLSTAAIAKRLTEGDFDTGLVRFTHIEGERATLLAKRASEVLPNFDAVAFITEAEPFEGRLFPDTYFVPIEYTDEELLSLLLATFDEKIASLTSKVEVSPLSLDEILVLASIIEREASDPESMRMVSGILQNRLDIDMPLQADASIEYILDKPLAELTPEDLDIESPYNTYLNTGLPPTPIGNPGLDAITAVLEPTESDYFYYITDNEGVFHYAKTYNEHLRNIEKYLK